MNIELFGCTLTMLAILGILAFFVSLITEMTKELVGIKKIPTKLYAMLVSLVVTLSLFFVYVSYTHIIFYWYYIIVCIFAAFVVAYISIYGWETFNELWKRFVPTNKEE